MAESAVRFLLNKLSVTLEEEVKLLGGVRKDFEDIRNELERMNAFLRTADTKEENNQQLQVLINQLRNIAYETEDMLDEFILCLGHHQGHGVYGFLNSIARSIKNLKARHQIATELHGIKSRVNNICSGHERYPNKLDVPSSAIAVIDRCHDSRLDAILLEEAQLVGIEEPKKEIIEWLLDRHSKLKAISVVGMGGLGKTTLVKKVYADDRVKKEFSYRAWITVSQSFQTVELLHDIIEQLLAASEEPVPKGAMSTNGQTLKEFIKDFLGDKRYVIVLDDVWETNGWNAFKLLFPGNTCGSRLMLTTRDNRVAISATTEFEGRIYHKMPLSPKDSLTLFCRKIFHEEVCPPIFEDVSGRILKRCEGLPLAVATISGMLAADVRIERWEMVHRSLSAELEGSDMIKILSLSYDDLPYYLKSCLLYASIFPQEHLMERMRLIRLWIAEGFVEGKEGRTHEEVADGYLNELLNRSLLQIATTTVDERVVKCRMHDLLRDIIVSKSRHENFAMKAFLEDAGGPYIVRRLTIQQSLTNINTNMDVSHLRSLLVFGVKDLPSNFSISKLFHARFKMLKVLNLQGVPMEIFPKQVVKLYHLRYLSLRDTEVGMIPSSIGGLQYLETLDLRGTNVTELPADILRLHRLRHLLVYCYTNVNNSTFYSCQIGFKAPLKIGGLLSLQKLCCIKANSGNDLIKELGELKQLRSLRISNLRRNDGNAVCSSIQKITNLFSLFLVSDEIIDLQYLSSPLPSLQRLNLDGRLAKLPQWISYFPNLAKLQLSWSQLQDDPLESLHPLANLVELKFYKAYDGQSLHFGAGGFPRLRKLLLCSLVNLRFVRAEYGSLPRLEVVQIIDCQLLERQVPWGFEDLINLKSVEFGNMPGEFDKVIDVPDVRVRRYSIIERYFNIKRYRRRENYRSSAPT